MVEGTIKTVAAFIEAGSWNNVAVFCSSLKMAEQICEWWAIETKARFTPQTFGPFHDLIIILNPLQDHTWMPGRVESIMDALSKAGKLSQMVPIGITELI